MLYYMELDESKQYLEIKEANNIEGLRKIFKMTGNSVGDYVNGPSNILNCGVKMPLISTRTNKMYLISGYREYLVMKNFYGMSKTVMEELRLKESYKRGYDGYV